MNPNIQQRRFRRHVLLHGRVPRTGQLSQATAALQAKVNSAADQLKKAQGFQLPASTIQVFQVRLKCAQADLARNLGLPAGTIASLDAQCHPAVPAPTPVQSQQLPVPPPLYPAVQQPDIISPDAGSQTNLQPGDIIRLRTAPLTLEQGGTSLAPGSIFQYRTALHGNSPVTAVDYQIATPDPRVHAVAIAWLYGNGQYDRPTFAHSWDRFWADIDRAQIIHVWRNGVLLV